MRATLLTCWCVVSLLLGACSFDSSIDPNVQLGCVHDADCPSDKYTCQMNFCTPLAALPFQAHVSGVRDRYAPSQKVVANITFTSNASTAPSIAAGSTASIVGPPQLSNVMGPTPQSDGGYTVTYDITADGAADPEGLYTLVAVFHDAVSGVPVEATKDFRIDRTFPSIQNQDAPTLSAPNSVGAQYLNVPPTAVGLGTTVRVTFTASEELAAATVRAVQRTASGDVAITGLTFMTPTPFPAQSLTFNGALNDAAAPQGPATLLVTLTDVAGNISTDLPLTDLLTLDTRPPNLTTDGDKTFVFENAPFGKLDGGASYRIAVAPGALPEDGTVVVLENGGEIKAQFVQASAGGIIDLPVDPLRPHVMLIDAAFNASDAGLVRDVSLTYVAHGTHSDTDLEHRTVEKVSWLLPARHTAHVQSTSFPDLGLTVQSSAAWRHVADGVVSNGKAAMGFDADHGRLLRFGGFAGGSKGSNQTFTWDGLGWRDVSDDTGIEMPAGSVADVVLAQDTHAEQTVMLNGSSGRTFVWDGHAWSEPTSARPSARQGFAMAFDERTNRMVMFGGRNDAGVLGDTWVRVDDGWLPLDAGNAPLPREGATMAYDPKTKSVLLFGGSAGAELWSLDGTTAQWTLIQPFGTAPPATSVTLVHDVRLAKMRVVATSPTGVTSYRLDPDGGTSYWVGEPSGVLPPGLPALGAAQVAYDSKRDLTFVTDGTWRLRFVSGRGQWGMSYVSGTMAPATGASIAIDPTLPVAGTPFHQLVMAGGSTQNGVFLSNPGPIFDTWTWTSEGWRPMATSGVDAGFARHDAVLEPVASGLLFSGGNTIGQCNLNCTPLDSFTWAAAPPDAGAWSDLGTGDFFTAGASNGTDALLELNDGGFFVYRQSAMSPVQVAMPGPVGARMMFDPVTKLIVAFGGLSAGGPSTNQMWTSDFLSPAAPVQLSWTPLGATALAPRTGQAMYFDEGLQRVMMYGGGSDSQAWALDPTGWVAVDVAKLEGDDLPPSTSGMAMGYDEASSSGVLFGGSNGSARSSETWQLTIGGLAPAVLFHTGFEQQISFTYDDVALNRLTIEARAGSDGSVNGAKVLTWNDGRWEVPPLAIDGGLPNAAPSSSPQPAALIINDAATVERLLRGRRELSVAVTSVGHTTTSPALLSVEDLAVTLDYRITAVGP